MSSLVLFFFNIIAVGLDIIGGMSRALLKQSKGKSVVDLVLWCYFLFFNGACMLIGKTDSPRLKRHVEVKLRYPM